MSKKTMTVEQVNNVRDRTLKENYSVHDVLQEYLEVQLEGVGFDVEQYGTDNRDHDGDRITYGESPDISVWKDGGLLCYIELKSKRVSSHDWFGRLNRSSFEECVYGESDYTQHESEFPGADNLDVDVYIYFGVVDEDKQLVIRDGFIKAESEEQVVTGFTSHGNAVVELNTDDTRNLNWLMDDLDLLT